MTHALARARKPPRTRVSPRRPLAVPIALQLIAMLGLGVLLTPLAADWFSTLGHNADRSGYVRAVAGLSDSEREAGFDAAREYNAHLPETALLDPYLQPSASDPSASEDTDASDSAAAYAAYEEILRVAGSDAIAEVVYPRLNIGLPLYHGTGDAAITRGVGHLYGSSLPVGGPSTHAVLTSHSGQVRASLFTKLPQARVGDVFEVRVLGETLFYRVEDVETVEPFVTDSLNVVAGEDRVTLFTCTPIGVNSHRFLVHGVRIPEPRGPGGLSLGGDGVIAGFPWWLLAWLLGSGAVAYLLFVPRRARGADRKRSAESLPGPEPTSGSG